MLNTYEPERLAAIRQYGPMAKCDHGRPLADGCMQCQVAGHPVLED